MGQAMIFSAQRQNWCRLVLISLMLYGVTSGNNKALVHKIEVLVNDTVSILCYTNASIDIQWHFNTIFNYVFAGGRLWHPYKGRLRTEDDNAGIYTLIIPKVRSEDAGWYYCSEEATGRRISSTHLTVLYSNPVCYSNMHSDGFIGPNTCNLEQENMIFNCAVSFNGTSPHLIWRSLNDNRTLNSSICEDKPNRRNCSLILTSDPTHDGSIFICQTTASIKSRFNCSTEANKILYLSSISYAKKYVNDNVYCSANINLNVKYNWTLQQGKKVSFLSSKQIILLQKPGIYQCEVNYSIRNYSCLSIASIVNVSIESTNGGTISRVTALAVVFPIVLMFAVLSVGMVIWIRKHSKRKREKIIENTRIRERVEGMYTNFVSKVDPQDILEPLIQKHVISKAEGDNVLKRETCEDKCQALLDCLSSSSHIEAFIVLKNAISEYYPGIAERIDANDNSPVKTIQENEKIKDKIVSMYVDFSSRVDPRNVFDNLIQSRIVSMEERQSLMNKDSAKERCRGLIDHLFCCSKENAFIALKYALQEHYPDIVKRIEAPDSDDESEDDYCKGNSCRLIAVSARRLSRIAVPESGIPDNEKIRNRIFCIYDDFVSDVDPVNVFDLLIQSKIVNVKQKQFIMKNAEKDERCRALLDHLLFCSKEKAFIILKEALEEHYPEIVERIDNFDADKEIELLTQFESCIIMAGFGNDEEKDEDVVKIKLNGTKEVYNIEQLPSEMMRESAAAIYGNSLFVAGIGYYRDKIWKFDAQSSTWEYCNIMIRGRRRHSVAFVDQVLYICGGWVDEDEITLDDVEAYDTIDDRRTTVGKLVHGVQNAGNCVHFKNSLYIFGGQEFNGKNVKDGREAKKKDVDYVQVYDTKLNSCTLLSKRMPVAYCFLRAVLWENKVILLGCHYFFIYNFDTKTLQMRNHFKTDVTHFGSIVHNGKLFVIGGAYRPTKDVDGNEKSMFRDDVRSVPIANVLNNESIEWLHHAKLPKPTAVFNFGKMEFPVQ